MPKTLAETPVKDASLKDTLLIINPEKPEEISTIMKRGIAIGLLSTEKTANDLREKLELLGIPHRRHIWETTFDEGTPEEKKIPSTGGVAIPITEISKLVLNGAVIAERGSMVPLGMRHVKARGKLLVNNDLDTIDRFNALGIKFKTPDDPKKPLEVTDPTSIKAIAVSGGIFDGAPEIRAEVLGRSSWR